MSAAHRFQDEWLLSYAAGSLTHGRSLMVASHVAYHDDLREIVSDGEALGGALLESVDPQTVDKDVLDRVLARLDDVPAAAATRKRTGILPGPLANYLDTGLDSLNWRFMGPGMRSARLWNGPNDERLWLLRARGGVAVPEHGHNGDEWTLVLKGSFQTDSGCYRVGDIDVADESIEHQPIIDDDDECICLVLTEGPIRLKSLAARMAQPFIGL